MTMNTQPTHTPAQIAALRAAYDVPENFVPVTSAGGALVWITENAAKARG